jgi:hypothetical protein
MTKTTKDDYSNRMTRWPNPWARQHCMSARTARRLHERGEGPVLTQISERISAVTAEDDARWVNNRRRSAAQQPLEKPFNAELELPRGQR